MLIEQLGHDAAYALNRAYLMIGGRTCRISSVSFDRITAFDIEAQDVIHIPSEELTGWRDLKFPQLGYRRMRNGLWGWAHRAARSYTRGLNPENTSFALSPYVVENRLRLRAELGEEAAEWMEGPDHDYDSSESEPDTYYDSIMQAIFKPEWDGRVEFRQLLAGERKCWIPAARFLVEPPPTISNDYNHFVVYVDRQPVGGIAKDGKVLAKGNNTIIINNMLRRYAY